jgi:hypothetical protein
MIVALVLLTYPIKENRANDTVILNNTVAYAIAFACWYEGSKFKIIWYRFSYKGNLHFAEAAEPVANFGYQNVFLKECK